MRPMSCSEVVACDLGAMVTGLMGEKKVKGKNEG